MCYPIRCRRCGKIGWAGYGKHIDTAIKDVPISHRCTCQEVPDDDPCDCGCPDGVNGNEPDMARSATPGHGTVKC